MAEDTSRGGWLRGFSGGSDRKSDAASPRIGKPLSVAVAEKSSPATKAAPNRATRGANFRPDQLFHHFRLQQPPLLPASHRREVTQPDRV